VIWKPKPSATALDLARDEPGAVAHLGTAVPAADDHGTADALTDRDEPAVVLGAKGLVPARGERAAAGKADSYQGDCERRRRSRSGEKRTACAAAARFRLAWQQMLFELPDKARVGIGPAGSKPPFQRSDVRRIRAHRALIRTGGLASDTCGQITHGPRVPDFACAEPLISC
jgi:hypothetical protein